MRNNKKKLDIEIGYTNLLISLPIFIAHQNGIFERYGLNVELKEYDSAEKMISALNNGEIDVCGYCALPVTFNSMSNNQQRILYLGGVFEDNEHQISLLLIKKRKKINSFHELSNKKIGIFPTKAYEVWIYRVLQFYGVNRDNINIINLSNKYDDLKKQIETEDFSAIFINSSIATEWLFNLFEYQKFEPKALIPSVTDFNPFYFGSFNIREDYAFEYPEIVRKISLSLDRSIEIISESSYSVKEALHTFLPELRMPSVKYFPLFKKTNDVKNLELERLKSYYFNQGVFKNGIEINSLQYQYSPLGTKLKFRWDNFVTNSKKHIPLISILLTIIGLIITLIISNRNIKTSIAQSNKRFEILQKSTPAQFFLYVSPYERAILSNSGISSLIDIKADWRFYFISRNEDLILAENLYDIVKSDSVLLNLFRNANLIYYPEDFDGLFGTDREFTIAHLQPFKKITSKLESSPVGHKTHIDNSPNAILNALRCNEVLKTEMIMRWRIQYNEELSNKRMIAYKYMWFDVSENNNYKCMDLEFVLGGNRLIEIIENYENNTKDIIYK